LRHHGKGKHVNKTTVLVIFEHDGRLVAGPVPDESKYTLEPIIRENVAPGTIVSSDCHCAYRDLSGEYEQGYVDYRTKEYVRGIHHTYSIADHWSLLKSVAGGAESMLFTRERSDLDDGLTKLVGQAFDAACRELHDRGQPPIVQEILAKRIIDAVRRGERDPERLRDAALSALKPK
jgi:hypothetical protein